MVRIDAVAVGDIPAYRFCQIDLDDGNPSVFGVSLMGSNANDQDPGEYGIPEFNTTGSFSDGDEITIETKAMKDLWEVEAATDLQTGVQVRVGDGGKAEEATSNSTMSIVGYTLSSSTAGEIAKIIPYQQTSTAYLRKISAGSGSYTDQDAITAINNDADHGQTASHNYFSGDYADLSGVNVQTGDLAFDPATQGELDTHAGKAGVHHSKYTDSNAVSAMSGASISPASVTISDVLNMPAASSTPGSPSTGDIYVDDGTNTSSGSTGFRYYDGSAWVDL